jgi:hypothetical protein
MDGTWPELFPQNQSPKIDEAVGRAIRGQGRQDSRECSLEVDPTTQDQLAPPNSSRSNRLYILPFS